MFDSYAIHHQSHFYMIRAAQDLLQLSLLFPYEFTIRAIFTWLGPRRFCYDISLISTIYIWLGSRRICYNYQSHLVMNSPSEPLFSAQFCYEMTSTFFKTVSKSNCESMLSDHLHTVIYLTFWEWHKILDICHAKETKAFKKVNVLIYTDSQKHEST